MIRPSTAERVIAAADAHNANPRYQAAGYGRLIPHEAEIIVPGRPPIREIFNVLDGHDPGQRLRAVNFNAQYRDAIVRVWRAPMGESDANQDG